MPSTGRTMWYGRSNWSWPTACSWLTHGRPPEERLRARHTTHDVGELVLDRERGVGDRRTAGAAAVVDLAERPEVLDAEDAGHLHLGRVLPDEAEHPVDVGDREARRRRARRGWRAPRRGARSSRCSSRTAARGCRPRPPAGAGGCVPGVSQADKAVRRARGQIATPGLLCPPVLYQARRT